MRCEFTVARADGALQSLQHVMRDVATVFEMLAGHENETGSDTVARGELAATFHTSEQSGDRTKLRRTASRTRPGTWEGDSHLAKAVGS